MYLVAWFRKNEAGLIFIVLGHNSIYSWSLSITSDFDFLTSMSHFDFIFSELGLVVYVGLFVLSWHWLGVFTLITCKRRCKTVDIWSRLAVCRNGYNGSSSGTVVKTGLIPRTDDVNFMEVSQLHYYSVSNMFLLSLESCHNFTIYHLLHTIFSVSYNNFNFV